MLSLIEKKNIGYSKFCCYCLKRLLVTPNFGVAVLKRLLVNPDFVVAV